MWLVISLVSSQILRHPIQITNATAIAQANGQLVKSVSDSDGSQMDAGKLFHTRGQSMAKDRSPNVILVGETSSLIIDDDNLRPDQWR